MTMVVCAILRTRNILVCMFLLARSKQSECPPPENIAAFRSDLCLLNKGKNCLCSSNSNQLLTVYNDRYGDERFLCGSLIDKNDLLASSFKNFRLKLESADTRKQYTLVLSDPDTNVYPDMVRAHWIKERVPGSELKGIWQTELIGPFDSLTYTPPTPARNSGIHRYQLYVFEHQSTGNLSDIVDSNHRAEFNMKEFMSNNYLCNELVGGFQFNIEHTYDASNCIATATCKPSCGVQRLCLWSNLPCTNQTTISRLALSRQPGVQLHSAHKNASYLLVALIKEDRTFRSAWTISDITGDKLIAGTANGSVITSYNPRSLQRGSTYQVFLLLQKTRTLPAREQNRLRALTAIEMAHYVYFDQCSQIRGMFNSRMNDWSAGGDQEGDNEYDIDEDFYRMPYDYYDNNRNRALNVTTSNLVGIFVIFGIALAIGTI